MGSPSPGGWHSRSPRALIFVTHQAEAPSSSWTCAAGDFASRLCLIPLLILPQLSLLFFPFPPLAFVCGAHTPAAAHSHTPAARRCLPAQLRVPLSRAPSLSSSSVLTQVQRAVRPSPSTFPPPPVLTQRRQSNSDTCRAASHTHAHTWLCSSTLAPSLSSNNNTTNLASSVWGEQW